jgi:hypothetical protein
VRPEALLEAGSWLLLLPASLLLGSAALSAIDLPGSGVFQVTSSRRHVCNRSMTASTNACACIQGPLPLISCSISCSMNTSD